MTHELLNGLTSAEAKQVLGLGTRLIVPAGTKLFGLGDPADRLFLTERGRIRLTLPMQVRGREEDVFVEERISWSDRGLVGPDSALPVHPHGHCGAA